MRQIIKTNHHFKEEYEMKRYSILVLALVLGCTILTGCRRNDMRPSSPTNEATTHTPTLAPTTPVTRPATEPTEHATASVTTTPTDGTHATAGTESTNATTGTESTQAPVQKQKPAAR